MCSGKSSSSSGCQQTEGQNARSLLIQGNSPETTETLVEAQRALSKSDSRVPNIAALMWKGKVKAIIENTAQNYSQYSSEADGLTLGDSGEVYTKL